jgi:hypothetical protein
MEAPSVSSSEATTEAGSDLLLRFSFSDLVPAKYKYRYWYKCVAASVADTKISVPDPDPVF